MGSCTFPPLGQERRGVQEACTSFQHSTEDGAPAGCPKTLDVEAKRLGMPLRYYLGSPRLECVHRHLGVQSHHFLADGHVAACVCVSPFSSVPVSLSITRCYLP